MIQGSINQLLSIAAIGASLSPGVQRRAEARQTKKQLSTVSKELSQMNVTLEDWENETVTGKIAKETMEKQADLSKKLFEQAPSSKTYKQYVMNRAGTGKEPTMVVTEDPDVIAQEQYEQQIEQERADQEMLKEQDRVRKSREAAAIRQQLLSNAPTPMMGRRDK